MGSPLPFYLFIFIYDHWFQGYHITERISPSEKWAVRKNAVNDVAVQVVSWGDREMNNGGILTVDEMRPDGTNI
jgi:hypothetical protein